MSDENKKRKSAVIAPCLYFPKPGPENTHHVLSMAAIRSEELGIENIVVATTSGETGLAAAKIFHSKNLVIVTHSTGFLRPDFQELNPELRQEIEQLGGKILTCQHAFGGVARAVRKKFGTYELEELMAYTLRIFGEGVKVAIEIALMAADAGLISTRDLCLSVGGTDRGADAALILRPANAQNFFNMRVVEILAKPRLE